MLVQLAVSCSVCRCFCRSNPVLKKKPLKLHWKPSLRRWMNSTKKPWESCRNLVATSSCSTTTTKSKCSNNLREHNSLSKTNLTRGLSSSFVALLQMNARLLTETGLESCSKISTSLLMMAPLTHLKITVFSDLTGIKCRQE